MTRIGIASQKSIFSGTELPLSDDFKFVYDGTCDVLLIGTEPPLRTKYTSAKTLIVPDCINVDSLFGFSAGNVISYGLCSKDTITVSSLIGNRLVVSLQRELSALSGEVIPEQDFCISISDAENADSVLGTVGLLLVCGMPPDKISECTLLQ